MIHLLLKDNVNMKMQELHNVTEKGESFLYNNLFELNKNGHNLSVENLTSETTEYWEQKGYEVDNDLVCKQDDNQYVVLQRDVDISLDDSSL